MALHEVKVGPMAALEISDRDIIFPCNMRKIAQIHVAFRLPQWLADAVLEAARDNGTTFSAYVRTALVAAVTARLNERTPTARSTSDGNSRECFPK